MNEIKLIQKPIIEHQIVQIGLSVTECIKNLNIENLIATPETIKYLKELRADLNKQHSEYKSQFKSVYDIYMEPINEVKSLFKSEITEKFEGSDGILRDLIVDFENDVKANKKQLIESYFNELCVADGIDFLKFENTGIEIKLSITDKKYKEMCFEFVSKVVDDLELIKTNPYQAEILVLYKKTLNASKAIKEVVDRKEAERIEAERIKLEQTRIRQSLLVRMCFVYSDITKTYNYVKDNTLFIKQSEIENLSNAEFNQRIEELGAEVDKRNRPNIGAVCNQMNKSIEVNEPTVLQAPSVVKNPVVSEPQKQEEIFSATFEVEGTMDQLTALSEYLKSNNITYKNI